ncbi:Gfo/Idh/MocA family protein [Jiangella asiatica]|uniref:Gfo/Idh/MocA family oxidoreductase n=1 Tax=Jiangella asiatica TaxID=2530372 RepID=A0A4R5CNJ1_9ACTN|nr:Gfo/Idh/MocA family oxidoreductase [Jiangella asiatica]TDE01979.1 Gfo/Idh/MocA family oxidoreductase [Jiangella asiatica]
MSRDERIRTAIVGTGLIAGVGHLPALRELSGDVDVVAAVDVDRERVNGFADQWGIRGRFTELTAMLAAESPDLVIVATPPSIHPDHTVEALEAGAWVWCEKPPALSLAEYDIMTAAERDGGPYAAVVFQLRFGAGARHHRELLASGSLGRPLAAHCQTTWYRNPAYFEPEWRGNFRGDGGPAMALGIHQIDLMLSMLGPWQEVSAFAATSSHDIDTDDVSTAVVRFESGALATVMTSAVSPAPVSHLRIDTELATVRLTHLYRYRNADWTCTPSEDVDEQVAAGWANPYPDERTGHLAQLRPLIANIRAGERPETSGDGGRAAVELITSLYKSAFTGQTVKRGDVSTDDPFYHRLDGGRGHD